jgi:SAM-dependent methyltransferase
VTVAQLYAGRTFTAQPARVGRLTEAVRRWLDPSRPARILDVGCGTGEQLLNLARGFPRAELIGIDVSLPSIAQADEARHALPEGGRVNFVAGDYVEQELGQFDLILADSTLQFIDCPRERLFGKLASELRPGGWLVFTIPYVCTHNLFLHAVRGCFRALRSRLTDRIIFAAGKWLHRGDVPEVLLRERVVYMYLPHYCRLDAGLRELLVSHCGLTTVAEEAYPHASLAQMKHRLCAYRKGAASGGSVPC